MKGLTILAACALLLSSGLARAGSETEAGAYDAASQKMMDSMSVKPTGNADQDFVAMMIPHHQGAIDMAKAELKYGADPELRKMAGDIIQAQQREIAQMKDWQKRYPASASR